MKFVDAFFATLALIVLLAGGAVFLIAVCS